VIYRDGSPSHHLAIALARHTCNLHCIVVVVVRFCSRVRVQDAVELALHIGVGVGAVPTMDGSCIRVDGPRSCTSHGAVHGRVVEACACICEHAWCARELLFCARIVSHVPSKPPLRCRHLDAVRGWLTTFISNHANSQALALRWLCWTQSSVKLLS
jgi:hypothetical protein